jgi:nicotinamidase-related amidase
MAAGTLASKPYPWPWHGAFTPAKTALLVVRDGDIAPPGKEGSALLCSLVELASTAGVAVIDLPSKAWTTVTGAYPADVRAERPHLGGFTGTDLDFLLRRRRITDLIITGFPFELGADCTMRQANDLGYECLAVTDCCTGLSEETLAGAISSIQMSGGIFGAVAGSAAVLELLGNATPRADSSAEGA